MILQPDSRKKPGGGWILFCRIFVCGTGAFFVGGGLTNYMEHGRHLWVMVSLALFGLLLILLGIFTSDKTCEKIADSITCGF